MRRLAWLALPLALAACGEEVPLEVGEELLPDDAIRTFEVVLESSQFLLSDTSFALYGDVPDASFTILANAYENTLYANALAQYPIPLTLNVVDTLGISRVDSVPGFFRGELILVTDSAASDADSTNIIALHRIAEPWTPADASWNLRSAGTPWSMPGGTIGALVDTAFYAAGDTIILNVDSATIAAWADTANAARGARLSLQDPNTRVRATVPQLKLYARSRFKPDTVFTTVVSAPNARFVFTPPADSIAGDIRFNGLPTWRSLLRIRPDLRTATVSCGAGCTLNLRDATINRAELLLQPRAPAPGFGPELNIAPYAYLGLVVPEIPIERTPVGGSLGTTTRALSKEQFRDDAEPVGLVITEFIRQAVADTTTAANRRLDWIVLAPGPISTFGYGRFAAQPRLRLVLTTAREIQLP